MLFFIKCNLKLVLLRCNNLGTMIKRILGLARKNLLFFLLVIFLWVYLLEKLLDWFPELSWVFVVILILSFQIIIDIFYKTSESYIADADKIKAEIDSFVENEICLGNKNLLKKYKNSSREIGYGLPSLSFTKLIKDIEKRNKYCELSIAMIQERIKFHEAFIREWNLDPKNSLLSAHTIIAISLIIGAIGAKIFGLIWGVVLGAISYWGINEYQIYTKKRNESNADKAKHLADLNTITAEWQDLLNKFKSILN